MSKADVKRMQAVMVLGTWTEKWPFPLVDGWNDLWQAAADDDNERIAQNLGENLDKWLSYYEDDFTDEQMESAEAFLEEIWAGRVKAEVELSMVPANNLDSDFNETARVRFYKVKGKR